LDGSKLETKGPIDGNDFYVIANHYWGKIDFQLPPNTPGKKWYLVADTSTWWAENDGSLKAFNENAGTQVITDGSWTNTWAATFEGSAKYTYGANARSMSIFVEKQ
jgi:hypothetical protein